MLRPYQSPPWRAASVGLAATVAFARVHVGAHLPLDVVGGAALGVLLGSAWNSAVGSPPSPDHRVLERGPATRVLSDEHPAPEASAV